MEQDYREHLNKVTDGLNELSKKVGENTAYQKGLNLNGRLLKAEEEIEKKASWKALYLAIGLFISIITVGLLFAKTVN